MQKFKKIQQYSYALNQRIGKGYSSQVFKGKNDLTQQIVAIKVIHLHKLQQFHKNLLMSQIQILRKLKHPNIIALIDVYSTTNNCYLITEYCEQGDLRSLLKKQGFLPHKIAAPIVIDIMSGLQALQKINIVHRDLKPANILLSNGTAKIADFGFSKILNNSIYQNYNIGTPLYMPPQALQSNYYTPKHDVWSLGVLIFQILTGRVPFSKANSIKQLSQQLNKPIFHSVLINDPFKQIIRLSIKPFQQRASIGQLILLLSKNNQRFQQKFERTVPRGGWMHKQQFKSFNNTAQTFRRQIQRPHYYKDERQIDIPKKTKQIISKLNFCRYIYKVIKLIQTIPLQIPTQLCLTLKYKIDKLDQQLKLLNCSQFDKLKGIVKQYKIRYTKIKTQGLYDQQLIILQCQLLISKTFRLLQSQGRHQEYLPQHQSKIATVLDYSISLFQILKMQQIQGQQQALKVIDVGKMVEGKPARVQYFHLERIRKKLLHLKLL